MVEDEDLDEGRRTQLLDRLASGLEVVLEHAAGAGLEVAFEPEPGMFVERPSGYGLLIEHMGEKGTGLGLCLDVGHLVVTGDLPASRTIRAWAHRLSHVHLDDAAAGLHEHRMFGEGELDLPDALGALVDAGFDGLAAVELSRHSHCGAEAAARALERIWSVLSGSA